MTIFIYKAISPSNKHYIGISNNYEKRRKDHIMEAKKYKSKIEFKEKCSPAYASLNLYKREDQLFYNSCTSHMKRRTNEN